MESNVLFHSLHHTYLGYVYTYMQNIYGYINVQFVLYLCMYMCVYVDMNGIKQSISKME